MDEIWKDIPGFEGMYRVSNLGRIQSIGRVHVWKNSRGTRVERKLAGVIMDPQPSKAGYCYVLLSNMETRKRHSIHGLVASSFIGACPPGHNINHKDGDKSNNHAANLEYRTFKENIHHARDVLGWYRGEKCPNAKLTEKDVIDIRNNHLSGKTYRQLSVEYSVTYCTIRSVVKRETWSHVP